MYQPTHYVIRHATPSDAEALSGLAELDSARPLTGLILVGELNGKVSAALGLDDGRVIADPFARTSHLVRLLRAWTS